MPKNRNCQKQSSLHNLIFWSLFPELRSYNSEKLLKEPKEKYIGKQIF